MIPREPEDHNQDQNDPKEKETLVNDDDKDNTSSYSKRPGSKGKLKTGKTKVVRKRATSKSDLTRKATARQEEAGCCVFFCWSLKEVHRVFSLYRHYNEYLSRPARVVLMITSFFCMMLITGLMMCTDF